MVITQPKQSYVVRSLPFEYRTIIVSSIQMVTVFNIWYSCLQIMENKEINELVKIMGLQYKKKYQSTDDLKTLRYGRIMIMTDQDQVELQRFSIELQ